MFGQDGCIHIMELLLKRGRLSVFCVAFLRCRFALMTTEGSKRALRVTGKCYIIKCVNRGLRRRDHDEVVGCQGRRDVS